jgi:hypothetical protein
MRMSWAAAFVLVACGGSKSAAPTDELLCKKMSSLCSEAGKIECFTAEDWKDMAHDVGKETTSKFRSCVAKADNCGALTGCMVEVGLSINRDFGGKLSKHDDHDDVDTHDHDMHDHGAPSGDDTRIAVHYDKVTVRPDQDTFGHNISVSIELTAETDMPHVGGATTVEAACDNKTDKEDAFFMAMSDARKGDKKSDTIKMFDAGGLDAAPTKCELILSLERGATPPAKFCYQNGATTEGACK